MLIPDMFTGELTPPHAETDLSAGFDEFWKAYPSGPRKVAKAQVLAKWIKLGCAHNWPHIVAHVAWMRTQEDWIKQNGAFICAPLVYANQQRWLDWEPPTKPAFDPVAATKELLAERDRNYRPPSADIKAKLAELRREMR